MKKLFFFVAASVVLFFGIGCKGTATTQAPQCEGNQCPVAVATEVSKVDTDEGTDEHGRKKLLKQKLFKHKFLFKNRQQ